VLSYPHRSRLHWIEVRGRVVPDRSKNMLSVVQAVASRTAEALLAVAVAYALRAPYALSRQVTRLQFSWLPGSVTGTKASERSAIEARCQTNSESWAARKTQRPS